MSLQVSRGREDRKPFRTAFIRVDVEGEQRERTTYKTYEASEMLLMMPLLKPLVNMRPPR